MKQICKRSLAAFLLLVMLVGYFSGITIRVNAASYVYNWGERGEVATELSDAAEAWYAKYNTSYAKLSAYSGASSVSSVPSSALYQQLKTLMTNAHSFINDYGDNKTFARYTDCQNGGGAISSFYSGKSIGPSWDGTWNREHTWPNSKGLGGSDEDDVMMIRPTSISENSSRGNDAYGKSGGSFYDPNSESGGKYNLHGDVARICLYVYVRWGNTSKMWGSSGVMESKEVLLEWMEEDPVDTWELGRNDAVQSITGTRNVFVDYPELAFDLFNAEIPNNYDTPSGSAPAYTITATSNNTSYGTVSLSGKTITATPKTGYQVTGYTVTSGSATVTRSGNIFTVIPSTNCTVRINFEPRVQSTVTFIDRGVTLSSQIVYLGDSMAMPEFTGTTPDGYAFRGWIAEQIVKSETKPTGLYKAGSSYTPNGNANFYALFAKVEEGTAGEITYHLVTDMSQLSVGSTLVIASAGTYKVAMKANGGSNNRYAGTITKNSDNTITFTEDANIDLLTLGAGTSSGTYTFFSQANAQYLAAGTASGSNILKLQSSVDAAASFTITVDSSGVATVISKTSSDRNRLYYNSGSNIFACYASGQKDISLYVASGIGDLYYTTSPVLCDHLDTENVAAVAATCTESGYTAGVYCNDCGCYISGHEEIPATNHNYIVTVIPPTETEMGYTLSKCAACGDSYEEDHVEALGPTYVVQFRVPYGISALEDMPCGKNGITLPSAGVPTGEQTYAFVGWTTAPVDNSEDAPATVYAAGQTYTATAPTTLYAVYTYTVGGSGTSEYVLTDISNIKSSDTVVITMTYKDGVMYALDYSKGISAAPTAVTVEAANNKLNSEPANTLQWNVGGAAGAYVFYPAGSTDTWLYCTGTNNGVRIGTNTANTFAIDGVSGYLKHNGTSRYVGVYRSNPDWRCYTSTSVNIDEQVLGFYVKGEAGTTYYTTVIADQKGVESWNISLGDRIGVNFQMNLGESDVVSFAVAGKTVEANHNSNTYSISLAAAQMTDEIVVSINGEALAQTYSVRKYADTVLSGNYSDATKNLVKAMLCYGGAAQTAFDYKTALLANEGISVNAEAPTGETVIAVTDNLTAVNFYGASLVHKNRVAVRFYFTGDVTGLTFSQGTPVQKGNMYYIEVAGINPQQLGNTITLMVTDGNGETLTVDYSPLTYIVRMYTKDDTSASTKALVQALYHYYLAAKNYTA